MAHTAQSGRTFTRISKLRASCRPTMPNPLGTTSTVSVRYNVSRTRIISAGVLDVCLFAYVVRFGLKLGCIFVCLFVFVNSGIMQAGIDACLYACAISQQIQYQRITHTHLSSHHLLFSPSPFFSSVTCMVHPHLLSHLHVSFRIHWTRSLAYFFAYVFVRQITKSSRRQQAIRPGIVLCP